MSTTDDPRQTEATDGPATVEFRGEKFTVPTEYADYPIGVIEAVSDDAPAAIQLRELLGPEQWAKVREICTTGRDLNDLTRAVSEVRGLDAGNSEASSA